MHVYTVGASYTGKSLLNKRLAHNFSRAGQNVIVFDPLRSAGWPENAVKFSSPELYLKHMHNAENAYNFIDEAKVLWDFDQKAADKILYQKRHDGILNFLIAQRTNMVPPNGRGQCSQFFIFRQMKKDADILRDEVHERCGEVSKYPDGEFCIVKGLDFHKAHLDFTSNPPNIALDTA